MRFEHGYFIKMMRKKKTPEELEREKRRDEEISAIMRQKVQRWLESER